MSSCCPVRPTVPSGPIVIGTPEPNTQRVRVLVSRASFGGRTFRRGEQFDAQGTLLDAMITTGLIGLAD